MRTVFTVVAALLLFASALVGQKLADIEKGVPEIKVTTEVDDEGQKQWGEFPHQNCPACKGSKLEKCDHCKGEDSPKKCPECKLTRKAPCHICGGLGKFSDPLQWSPCPGCNGHGVFVCFLCGNKGEINFVGGGKRGQKCNLCKGNGGVHCLVCNGKRLVASAFRAKVGTTKLKKLKKARANLATLISRVESFRCKEIPNKDRKAFAAMFKKTTRDFPALKKVIKLSDLVSKGLDKRIEDIERRQRYAFDRLKFNVLHYLVHERRVLDLCIARATANEEAAKKG